MVRWLDSDFSFGWFLVVPPNSDTSLQERYLMTESPMLVLSALPEELTALLNELTDQKVESWLDQSIYQGSLFGRPAILARSGVGKARAAMTTQHLCDRFKPHLVIFTGLAGALNPKFQIGDVVIGAEVMQHDLDASALGFPRGNIPYTNIRILGADAGLSAAALRASIPGVVVHAGRILTGDQFIHNRAEARYEYLTSELHGDAVEMEGAAVALVCHLNKIPWLLIRTISDRADGSAVDDFSQFLRSVTAHEVALLRAVLSDPTI
jgi:5'-methylthioadenosine/S-adenosylhomocysteine nucleosidase